MKRLILSALLAVSATGCSTVKEYISGDDTTEPPAELVEFEATIQIDTVWSRDVGAGPRKQYLKLVPAVHAERVYAAARDGEVGAYLISDGKRLWETDLDAPVSGGPGVGDGLVLLGTSDAEVLALDEAEGKLLWRARVSSEVLAPPAAADGVVVVRTTDGRLFGLNGGNGKRLWIHDTTVPILTLRGTSAPVIRGATVLNGSDDGRLVALALADGKPHWEAQIATPRGRSELERMVDIDAEPLVIDDVVYVVTYQGRIAALDLFSGRVLWQRDMSSHAGIGADARNIYVSDDEGHVWALDRYTSASLWRQTKLKGRAVTAPAAIGEYVVVGDFEGYLHWMRRDDGQFVARIQVDGSGISTAPVARGDTLLVYGNSGKLAALRVRRP